MKGKPHFSNRVRFNWGFHDAALAVREGWDCVERNFGFAKGFGPMTCPADVLTFHFDKAFAKGWQAGLHKARNGMDTTSSEPSWLALRSAGCIAE